MKNKKLFSIIAVLLVLIMALAGCGNNEAPAADNAVTSTADDTSSGTSSGKSDTAGSTAYPDGADTSAPTASGGSAETPEITSDVTSHTSSDFSSTDAAYIPADTSSKTDLAPAPDLLKESVSEVTAASSDGTYILSEGAAAEAEGAKYYDVDEAAAAVDSYRMDDSYVMADGSYILPDYDFGGDVSDDDEYYYFPTQISAGLLTAAEWNDNENFDFIQNLISNGQDENYKAFFTDWNLTPFSMFTLNVLSKETDSPVSNALVEVFDRDEKLLYTARTNISGKAFIYYTLLDPQALPDHIRVTSGEYTDSMNINITENEGGTYDFRIESGTAADSTLDLMFVVDTTGSMGDEIRFLQAELADVIQRVRNDNSGLAINLSVNFYRDIEDDYIVRSNPFSTDVDNQLELLSRENAYGGGDFEEAVELALIDAVENHQWSEDSTKILFLVLDAPPHNTAEIREKLADVLAKASAQGIRIIPIASSGIDKNTEFLLRTFAMVTGGTYTFLTDDSGIGGSHIEATVGDHVVEYLNDLLVRIINNYLNTEQVEPVPYTPADPYTNNPNYPDYTIVYDTTDDTDVSEYPEYPIEDGFYYDEGEK